MNRSATPVLRILSFVSAVLVLLLSAPSSAEACGGTATNPQCNRSIWLGASAPSVGVVRPDGSAAIEGVLLPFVTWTSTCPNPTNATLSFTIRCVPIGGGQGTSIGPVTVPMNTPTVPGAQTLANGTNRVVFTAPAGSLQPGTHYICTISGTYSVTFPSTRQQPVPSPTISAGETATICLVPNAPVSPAVPELNVRFLSPNGENFIRCRRGDQAIMHFLIENNRTDRSVTLNLASRGEQLAGVPTGFGGSTPQALWDSAVSAISNPKPGTDVFPAAWLDQMQVGTILDSGDPEEENPRLIERTLTLRPCESRVVSIAVRSHGMCADGSCNARDLFLTGNWSNGDTALACASTMLLVESVEPKTPLCEIVDRIDVSDSSQMIASPAQYHDAAGPIDHATTHTAGNLAPVNQVIGTQLQGDSMQNNPPLTDNSTEYIRLPDKVVDVTYNAELRPMWFDFVPFVNRVRIRNLPTKGDASVKLPFIYGNISDEEYQVDYNASDDTISVAIQGDEIYRNTLANLRANPPRGWRIVEGSCREFTKRYDPDAQFWTWVDPWRLARLLRPIPNQDYSDELRVMDASTGQIVDWRAQISGPGGLPARGAFLPEASGGGLLRVGYTPGDVQPFPSTNLSWVTIDPVTGGTALPVPPVPVILRTKPIPDWVHDLGLEQVDFISPEVARDSRNGLFRITYDPQPRPRYLNVIARPTTGRDPQPVWLVQNLLLPPFPDPNQSISYWCDLAPLGISDGDDLEEVEIDVFFDITWRIEPPVPEIYSLIEVDNHIFRIGNGGLMPQPPVFPFEPLPLPPLPKREDTTTWVYRGCTVPNLDLDSTRNKPDTGYAGDWNACGPVSAANSMQWLGTQHPELRLPSTLREKLRELSRLSGRSDTGGINTRMMLEAKLAFIDRHKLPIRVKFQGYGLDTADVPSPDTTYKHSARNDNTPGPRGTRPTWAYLVQEMEDDEDVEVKYGCYDTLGNRLYGHWITMTGVSQIGDRRDIYYKDDDDQRDTGGTRQRSAGWDTNEAGRPILTRMSNRNRRYLVEAIVSESFDTTVTFPDPPVKPTENLGFKRMDFFDPFVERLSHLGQATWQTESSNTTSFLNVYARLTPESQPVWLVQNMILPPFPESEEIAYWINYELLGIGTGRPLDSIWVIPEVGDEVIVAFTPSQLPDRWEKHGIESVPYVVPTGHLEAENRPISNFRFPPRVNFNTVARVDSVYRGCTVPNIDLDSLRNKPDTGYAGDWNACGPAAAANSIHWLEQTHPELDSTRSHRDKLRELSKMMGRANKAGVLDVDFIKGKLAYIDKYKLPIRVKFQTRWRDTNDIESPDTTGSNGDTTRGGYGHSARNDNDSNRSEPTWAFLEREMKAGEDVELVFQWTDSLGRNAGAHVVTVTGTSNANGTRRFWYKDDRNQRDTGGMQQAQVTWDTANGRPIIRELGKHDTLAYVTIIYSESYDSTVTFDTIAGTSSVGFGTTGSSGLDLTVISNPSDLRDPVAVEFRLLRRSETAVRVFDLTGRLIRSLHEGVMRPGEHRLLWDGNDGAGDRLPAGTYLLVVRYGDREDAVRIVRR